jgi:hypothetical protein
MNIPPIIPIANPSICKLVIEISFLRNIISNAKATRVYKLLKANTIPAFPFIIPKETNIIDITNKTDIPESL